MKQISKFRPTICILGGMGPQASARLLALLVEKASLDFGLSAEEFPEIIVDSVPVPDFISNLENKQASLALLCDRVKRLGLFEPDVFCICCNTAHIFLEELQKCTKSLFVSLINTVSAEVKKKKIAKVGIMATPVTIKSGLYQKSLRKLGVEVVLPKRCELEKIEGVIRRVLSGKVRGQDASLLLGIAKALRNRGAEGIILGCTELPLIFPKYGLPVFNSIEILADELLRKYYKVGI